MRYKKALLNAPLDTTRFVKSCERAAVAIRDAKFGKRMKREMLHGMFFGRGMRGLEETLNVMGEIEQT